MFLVERKLRDSALLSDGYRTDDYGLLVRAETDKCACSLRGELLLWDRVSLPWEAVKPEQKRFHLYRMIFRFMYGHLGSGVRVELPDCCVAAVHALYPDPNAAYIGFKPFTAELVEERDPEDAKPKKQGGRGGETKSAKRKLMS